MNHSFTSPRERRLWLWAATVLVLIYATMGQAPEIAQAIRGNAALRIAGGVVLGLVGLADGAIGVDEVATDGVTRLLDAEDHKHWDRLSLMTYLSEIRKTLVK